MTCPSAPVLFGFRRGCARGEHAHIARPTAAVLLVAVLALGGCATPPPLDQVAASFDAISATDPARITRTLGGTAFGGQVARAVSDSPRLRAATAGVEAARAREDDVAGAFLPRLALGAVVANANGLSPVAQITQLVYDGGAAASRRIAARARVYESRGARLELAAALALEAVEAWHAVLAARARADLAAQDEAAHRAILAQVEERSTAGAGVQADVLAARARLASSTSRALEARVRRDRAEAVYQQVFGQMPRGLGRPPAAPALASRAADAVVAGSPRVLALDAGIAAARADVAAAEAARFPILELRGRGTRAPGGDGLRGDVDVAVDYNAGFPGQRAAAIRAAEARLAGLEADRDALVRQIRRALADLQADRRAGAQRLQAARDAVAINRETVEMSREQFVIGRRSLLGLLDAQRDLNEASETQIAAEFELAMNGYAALALTGDIVAAFGIELPAAPADSAAGRAPGGQ